MYKQLAIAAAVLERFANRFVSTTYRLDLNSKNQWVQVDTHEENPCGKSARFLWQCWSHHRPQPLLRTTRE